jgi:hypothetical protein
MGRWMSFTMEPMKRRVDSLALIGGFAILVDTLWGGLALLGLDLARMNELVLGISLVLGLPIYLLDLWMGRRIAISMLGLFLFRWIATCFAGPTPVLCSPWRGSVLLISALVLLQLSKVRRETGAGRGFSG